MVLLAVCACGSERAAPPRPSPTGSASSERTAALPAHRAYPDLGAALVAIIPADARVIGLGELHARSDRASVTSSLARFTRALPAIADRLSDLVIETWLVEPSCGPAAAETSARVQVTMKRPEATKSEIAQLADAARAAGIQPHAMKVTCADYAAIAPGNRDIDPEALLTLTTRELRRIAVSAVGHRDREPAHRPWIAVYGGALHNDRFPEPAVAEWSYAADLDRATGRHFVEIDVVVPELAADDPAARRQPWFPLAGAPRDPATPVLVWTRGERSFVVVLEPT